MLPALGVLAFGLAFASAQTDTGGLGKISFPTSGGAEAQRRFLRGVAADNFAYEEAILEFQEAQRIDKGFAMAYWGEAMANNQTLWLNQDLEAARAALKRLGPTPEDRAKRAGTEKERGPGLGRLGAPCPPKSERRRGQPAEPSIDRPPAGVG